MPLQRPKCYILLEWACYLLAVIAMSSVIRNHRFIQWICFSLLKRTLKISHLNHYLRGGASGICLAYELFVTTKMEILKNTLKCIMGHRIRQCLHKIITGFINGFIKRKGIQTTYSDYLEKQWNISTYPWLSKFWANPFTILRSSSCKVSDTRQRFIEPHQICRIPHNPFSSHCFTHWTFCTQFEIHV